MPKEAPTKVSKRASAKSEDGKRRSKKDKSGPKRGLSAYMFFSQEQRPKVKEENPDANFGTFQILILLGRSFVADPSIFTCRRYWKDLGWTMEEHDRRRKGCEYNIYLIPVWSRHFRVFILNIGGYLALQRQGWRR